MVQTWEFWKAINQKTNESTLLINSRVMLFSHSVDMHAWVIISMVFYGVIFFIADWCVKTHKQLQVVNRREQCCAAPSEQCCQQGCSAMHDNNAVTALFNHQYCYNLLTRFNNNDNNNEQAYVLSILFSPVSTTGTTAVLLHRCWTTLLKQ